MEPSPRLVRLERLLERTRLEWMSRLEGVEEEVAAAKPSLTGWSAAEVGTHLVLVEEWVTVSFEKLFADPHDAPRAKGLRLKRLLILGVGLRRFHVPAPKAVVPRTALPTPEIRRRAGVSRARFLENLRFADRQPSLAGIVSMHPVFGPLTLPEWGRLVALHESRHAQQLIEALTAAPHGGA